MLVERSAAKNGVTHCLQDKDLFPNFGQFEEVNGSSID